MNITDFWLLLVCIIPAASYGWGMRGTTIGGEKGAMLPGALIGALLAHFSGILIVQEHIYVFAALGAIGMYFGGCMTYGETLSFSMSAYPAVNLKKGLIALLIKGTLWFGVFGAVFSTGVNAICGVYDIWQIILLIILTPALSLLCLNKINRPHNAEQAIFPKFYFSKTRKECWGALVGMIAAFVIINLTYLNFYSILFTIICGIFGGIGWVIGQCVYIFIKHRAQKSKLKITRFFSEQKGVDGWKAMECTFGAIGGLGSAIAFAFTYNDFKETVFYLELQGGIKPLNETLSFVLLIVWLVFIAEDMAHYFIKKASLKPVLEAIEFVLYAAFPFIIICFGCDNTSKVMSLFMLFWVLAQEVAFEKKYKKVFSISIKVILTIVGIVFLVASFTINKIQLPILIITYTIVYELLTLLWLIPEIINTENNSESIDLNRKSKIKQGLISVLKNKGFIITHLYFIIVFIFISIILT